MGSSSTSVTSDTASSFGEDVQFVNPFSKLIVLSNPNSGAMIAVSPSMQGRVLTSSADGWNGRSFGWVNRKLIASREIQQHFNAFGGEDRLWIGPEGGQFSIFFAPHQPFDLAHWFTPAALDTESFEVVRQSRTSVELRKSFGLTNYSGTNFRVQIDRKVHVLSSEEISKDLQLTKLSGLKVVGFESVNKMTNVGAQPWTKEKGLLSLWILGQFQASSTSTIAIPIHEGSVAELGQPVNSNYFGKVPADRLVVRPRILYFKADARYRSKLGVNPLRETGILGSYDSHHHVLTLVQHTLPPGKPMYVNSAWEIQDNPYQGDSENAYNDGPQSPGGPQMGNFYEMESSSPAAALEHSQSIEHTQRTFHFQGSEQELNEVALKTLGVGVDAIRDALSQ